MLEAPISQITDPHILYAMYCVLVALIAACVAMIFDLLEKHKNDDDPPSF